MLVLSRKKNQTIRIGDEIILKVIDVRGGIVRLGFEAPDDVSILRSELIPGHDDHPAQSDPLSDCQPVLSLFDER